MISLRAMSENSVSLFVGQRCNLFPLMAHKLITKIKEFITFFCPSNKKIGIIFGSFKPDGYCCVGIFLLDNLRRKGSGIAFKNSCGVLVKNRRSRSL